MIDRELSFIQDAREAPSWSLADLKLSPKENRVISVCLPTSDNPPESSASVPRNLINYH